MDPLGDFDFNYDRHNDIQFVFISLITFIIWIYVFLLILEVTPGNIYPIVVMITMLCILLTSAYSNFITRVQKIKYFFPYLV